MEIKEILKTVDHTLLLPASTWSEIKEILDDAMKYETASICEWKISYLYRYRIPERL